jgi:hypothetical protein
MLVINLEGSEEQEEYIIFFILKEEELVESKVNSFNLSTILALVGQYYCLDYFSFNISIIKSLSQI